MSSPVIVTGMHRSGTSLLTSFLSLSGLHIGNDLVVGASDNPRGYFEDKEFVEFHKRVIRKSGRSMFEIDRLLFDADDVSSALELLRAKSQTGLWGWKDPRTVLALKFWKALLPSAKVILVFRHPLAVIDSLFRRRSDPELTTRPHLAAKGWLTYNRSMLEFLREFPRDSVLVDIDELVRDASELTEKLNSRFALGLAHARFESVFDPDLLGSNVAQTFAGKAIFNLYRRPLLSMYEQLCGARLKIG